MRTTPPTSKQPQSSRKLPLILCLSVPSRGGSNELRNAMSVGPDQDLDSKKCIHLVTKRSFALHLEYVNVDPKK